MATIGYAQLISRLSLVVRPLAKPAEISGSVNRRVDSADRVLFPRGVAIEDTGVRHFTPIFAPFRKVPSALARV